LGEADPETTGGNANSHLGSGHESHGETDIEGSAGEYSIGGSKELAGYAYTSTGGQELHWIVFDSRIQEFADFSRIMMRDALRRREKSKTDDLLHNLGGTSESR
jgi:hypothetical protein